MTAARTSLVYRGGFWIVMCAILCFGFLASGQEITGTFLGVVSDPSGAGVPDATVTATSERNPRGVSTAADSTGHYILANLPVGIYSVEVSAPGFSRLKQENINIQIGSQFN